MASKVVIGCRLPNGIILEHPENPAKKVLLNGLNKVTIIGAPYAHNDVDSDFWDAWLEVNKDFAPLKNGAIFVAKSSEHAAAKGREVAKEKTGFEAMPQVSDGVKPAAAA
jgi:hypothetical protein